MSKLLIKGGTPLKGEVTISGAKNAALPILAATLLTDAPVKLCNVPKLKDITTMLDLLKEMGAKTTRNELTTDIHIQTDQINQFSASYDLVRTMRASILV